jgi:hypothetical protein
MWSKLDPNILLERSLKSNIEIEFAFSICKCELRVMAKKWKGIKLEVQLQITKTWETIYN